METQLARNLPRAKVRILRRIEGLSERAVDVLGELLESESDVVRLGAVKQILDRRYGKPRAAVAEVQADLNPGSLHLDALRQLADRGLAACDPEAAR